MSAIRTRKPTGKIPYPFVVVEGGEGTGKTYSQLALSADERIKHAFHIDLGEGSADEYAALGSYDVIEHNGTFEDIVGQVRAVKAFARDTMAADPAAVVLLTIDSMTALWNMLVDEANATAKARCKDDPTMDLWNKAKKKWRAVVDELMTFPGIVVVAARGGEVVDVVNGKPTNQKIWKMQTEKNLGYDVNVIVRFVAHQQAVLVKARSLKPELAIPAGRTLPLPRFSLAELIFDKMGCGTEPIQVRTVTELVDQDGIHVNTAKKALYDALVNVDPTGDHKALASEKWAAFEKKNGAADYYPQTKVDALVKSVAA